MPSGIKCVISNAWIQEKLDVLNGSSEFESGFRANVILGSETIKLIAAGFGGLLDVRVGL